MGKRKMTDSAHLLYFGERVYQSRTSRKWSQTVLADFAGVNRQTICDWEQGIYDIPLTKMLEICNILNINPKEIV